MEPLLRELAYVLRAQYDAAQEYLVLAQEQKFAIANNRVEELQDLNTEIDQFSVRFDRMDRDRMELMEAIAERRGVEMVRLSDLLAGVDHSLVSEVLEQATHLREVLAKVAEENLRNQKLLRASREFVRGHLAVLTGYNIPQPQTKFATYGSNGRMNMQRQQQIQIMNRSY